MIITLSGSNHFLLQQELNGLVNKFTAEFSDIGLEKLDGEEVAVERLVEAATSLPFLVDKKLVILKNPSVQKAFVENIESTLNNVPDRVDLVILEPKLDKRSSYFKLLKSKTDYKEFAEPDSQKLNTWIVQYAKEQGGQVSLLDANYLLERVGHNQQQLSQEVDKLITYDANISRTNIDLLTEPAPQSTVFELLDSAFAGNSKKTLELYKQQRAQKVEPQQIIAMLAWQLHALAIVMVADNKSSDEIAREAKINPYVVRKTQNLARRINLLDVKRLIKRALNLDTRLKSQNINADEALQHFLLTIA